MCKATLLPDPESPLRMMMRTPPCYPATAPLANFAAAAALSGRGGPCRVSDAQRAHRGGVVVGALLLVFLDAAIELVRQQIDGRVHVFLGCVRVDGTTAHV